MTGKPLLDKVLIIINLLGFISTLGIFSYTEFIYKRPMPKEEEEKAKLHAQLKKQVSIPYFKLESMVLNLLPDNDRLRFLEVEMNIEPTEESYIKLLESHKIYILDIIVNNAGKLKAEEINSISGKILFENRIKTKINEELQAQVIKKIYFLKFIVE
ncbi:MAG: flagellar basal body-associated FliL family protein [Bacteriovoracaceae bacterium]